MKHPIFNELLNCRIWISQQRRRRPAPAAAEQRKLPLLSGRHLLLCLCNSKPFSLHRKMMYVHIDYNLSRWFICRYVGWIVGYGRRIVCSALEWWTKYNSGINGVLIPSLTCSQIRVVVYLSVVLIMQMEYFDWICSTNKTINSNDYIIQIVMY